MSHVLSPGSGTISSVSLSLSRSWEARSGIFEYRSIFYGDYGIFIKKDIFWKIGGYDEIPFLEDVELCRKAKRHGQLMQIHSRIVTSPRRYLKKGKLKLAAAFMLANLFNSVGWRPGFLWNYIVEM